ncbi:hypothetical protein JW777_00745 [bacterium]|nr:hypothetical protein [bacterium]
MTKPVKNMGGVEEYDSFVKRKYVCLQCRKVFTTTEEVDEVLGQTSLDDVANVREHIRPQDRRKLKAASR